MHKHEKPHKPSGTNSPASRHKKSKSANSAAERARRRFAVVSEARRVMEQESATKTEAYAILRQRAKDPEDPFKVKMPARATFYSWLAKAKSEGPLSLKAFLDRPRAGRPRLELPRPMHDAIVARIRTGIHSSNARLFRWVVETFGDEAPSRHVFDRFMSELDPAMVSAAHHGSKAAISDSLPKLTIPVDYPHQVWAEDELTLPVYIKAWDPEKKHLISMKTQVGIVLDAYSRACIAHQVFRPFSGTGKTARGYQSEEITALLFSAALPDVAAPLSAEYTGFLPHSLRMDNHATHFEVRELWKDNGVDVADLRVGAPWANGIVEALVETLKELCEDVPGAEHKFLPADKVSVHPKGMRSQAAAGGSTRITRKIVVAVENLLSYEELAERFAGIVRKYNARPHSGLDGRSPQDVYHSALRRDRNLRPGSDAILFLPARTITMGTELRVLGERFAPEVNGRLLRRGEKIVLRVDPGRRGLWVVDGTHHHFVPTLKEYAHQVQPGQVVREERAQARELSDLAQEELEAHVERELGPGAVARGKAAADAMKSKPYRRKGRVRVGPSPETEEAKAKRAENVQPIRPEPKLPHAPRRAVGLGSLGNRIKRST